MDAPEPYQMSAQASVGRAAPESQLVCSSGQITMQAEVRDAQGNLKYAGPVVFDLKGED